MSVLQMSVVDELEEPRLQQRRHWLLRWGRPALGLLLPLGLALGWEISVRAGLFSGRLVRILGMFPVGNVDARADVPRELTARAVAQDAAVQNPSVLPVVALKPVFHPERFTGVEGSNVGLQAVVVIVGVDVLGPAVPEFLLDRAANEVQPRLVEPRTQPVRTANPDQNRGGIGHEPESLLALAQRMLGALALGDVDIRAGQAQRLAGGVLEGGKSPKIQCTLPSCQTTRHSCSTGSPVASVSSTLATAHGAVVGVDQLLPGRLRPAKFAGRQAIYRLLLRRPDVHAGLDVPVKHADLRSLRRQPQPLLALSKHSSACSW